jgi:hypothetical protein
MPCTLLLTMSSVTPRCRHAPTAHGFAVVRDDFDAVFFFTTTTSHERDMCMMRVIDRIRHSRMQDSTLARLKLEQACDQCHSSRKSTLLPVGA